MKKLALAAALMVPLFVGLYACTKTPTTPKAPEAVRVIPLDNFAERFPAHPPVAQGAPVTSFGEATPTRKSKRTVKRAHPRPNNVPDVVEYEHVPPVVHLPCLFPFNLIPTCTPGANQ